MTVDPTRGRFLFHHEADSQFFPTEDEVLVSCPASICRAGTCTCAPGVTLCPDGCHSLLRDADACGACGSPCTGAGESCNGTCRCDPAVFDGQCGTDCVDHRADDARCGDCFTTCAGDQDCIDGTCVNIPELRITSLSTASCTDVELGALIGDAPGGFAVAGGRAFVNGSTGLGVVDLPALTGAQDRGPTTGYDYVVSDLRDDTLWGLYCAGDLCTYDQDSDGIARINPATGAILDTMSTGQSIDDVGFSMVFSGVGRHAVLAPSGLFITDHATGFTERAPTPPIWQHPPTWCYGVSSVGILERSGGDDFLVYLTSDNEVGRMRVRDGAFEVILTEYLGGACALSLSPADNRWLFVAHGTNGVVANPSDRTQLVSCPAVFTCAGCP